MLQTPSLALWLSSSVLSNNQRNCSVLPAFCSCPFFPMPTVYKDQIGVSSRPCALTLPLCFSFFFFSPLCSSHHLSSKRLGGAFLRRAQMASSERIPQVLLGAGAAHLLHQTQQSCGALPLGRDTAALCPSPYTSSWGPPEKIPRPNMGLPFLGCLGVPALRSMLGADLSCLQCCSNTHLLQDVLQCRFYSFLISLVHRARFVACQSYSPSLRSLGWPKEALSCLLWYPVFIWWKWALLKWPASFSCHVSQLSFWTTFISHCPWGCSKASLEPEIPACLWAEEARRAYWVSR